MKENRSCFLVVLLLTVTQACTQKTQQENETSDVWTAIPSVSLPKTWTQVPAGGHPADSVLVARLQLQPRDTGPEAAWTTIGKLTANTWRGLLYTYTDADASELHLTTYNKNDSLLSDQVLINDRIVGILTSGTFSASIDKQFVINLVQRLKTAASETDSTIIADKQTEKKLQIGSDGVIKIISNTSINHVAESATHPEEEQEGTYYREYRYQTNDQSMGFVFTIMGQELEKHYYFENKQGEQEALTLTSTAESDNNTFRVRRNNEYLSSRWLDYRKEGDISVPQRIEFTFPDGTKRLFVLQ